MPLDIGLDTIVLLITTIIQSDRMHIFVCLSDSLSVSLSLSVCLYICLFDSLSACLILCLSV